MSFLSKYSVVDLFCGVGGLTRGFMNEGFEVTTGIDIDSDCEFSYNSNNYPSKFLRKSVSDLKKDELNSLFRKETQKILIGCAPCQPFSIFNRKNKGELSSQNSERWKLLYSFSNLIKISEPVIISMENVPLLKNFQGGIVFKDFIDSLEKLGYKTSYGIYDAQYYGVPQRRKRLVLLASKLGDIEMIPYTHSEKKKVTVRKALGDLPSLNAGEIDKIDYLHRSRALKELSLKRIKATPEGGGWKDWDRNLVAECHRKSSGKAFGSAYGRMSWDDVSPTITTCCIGYNNGKFGHPEQDRAISLREAALLQSFPKEYKFIDPERKFSSARIARQIGNAVPVGLGQAIAKSIRLHLENYDNAE